MESVFLFSDALRETTSAATIVDMSQVEHVDSVGLGAIVIGHVSHERAGRKLVLAGVPPRVSQLLKIAGLSPVFTIFDSVEAAEGFLPTRS